MASSVSLFSRTIRWYFAEKECLQFTGCHDVVRFGHDPATLLHTSGFVRPRSIYDVVVAASGFWPYAT